MCISMYCILIVSDDVVLRKTLAFSLNDMDARVEYVDTMAAMMVRCREEKFDLVILLGLAAPMCREGVVSVLRPQKTHSPRFYVISWQQSEIVAQSMYESGVDQYMTLPMNLGRLRSKIQNEMSRAR